jgi:chromosome partitioning protein
MRTITLASGKGGNSKSTLTVTMAVQAMKDGSGVAILDFEPQNSASLWWMLRGKPAQPMLVRDGRDPVKEARRLRDMGGTIQWAFIDTPASGMDIIERAIIAADFVLIPVQASVFDLAAVRCIAELCADHNKKFAFILTREQPRRDKLNNSAIAHLKKLGPVLEPTMAERATYVSATALGKAAAEHPDRKQASDAKQEAEAIWTAVKKAAGAK